MAAGRPAFVVVLIACAAVPLLLLPAGDGARTDDDIILIDNFSWCIRKECECAEPEHADGQSQQVSAKCTFSGEKNIIFEQNNVNKDLNKFLVSVELVGDSSCKLTIHSRAVASFTRLRSFSVIGFDEVTVKEYGLMIKNEDSNFTVTIGRVGRLLLHTNSIQPKFRLVDVLIEDCISVRLNGEVISKLRSFAFRRIENLTLSENTFKGAAASSVIASVILENLTADKLPSHSFVTSIDLLSITNCTFGSIERNAFPINSMVNVTLTNVTVNRVETEAFTTGALIINLRITGCHVQVMENDAIASVVQSIHIEQSEFKRIQSGAVHVVNELVLINNTFDRVESNGFLLFNLHSIRVDGNAFAWLDVNAFFEPPATAPQAWSELRFHDNVFQEPMNGTRWPAVRLQRPAKNMNVTGNRFLGSCGCGPWQLIGVVEENDTAADGNGDGFAERNYCRADGTAAECANVTSDNATDRRTEFRISEFFTAAGCDRDAAREIYENCVRRRSTATHSAGRELFGNFPPTTERGIIATMVLLVLCCFGTMCAVSAVTWLNARGCFSKVRRYLFSDRVEGIGASVNSTESSDSLTQIPMPDYDKVQVIIYQDKVTQTLPEELSHEVLQSLRDKLEDPEDYVEAREMIEHLYDLIRVEERAGGSNNWYSTASGLDDITSTITTKAVTVCSKNGRGRDVKTVGTCTPSLDRLDPSRTKIATPAGRYRRPEQSPPIDDPYRSPWVSEYMDPADLLAADADIYCELIDIRTSAEDRPSLPPVPPLPVPNKSTEV